jgi:hypothetical protein
VVLERVGLSGTATKRRVDFEVSVDGTTGAAVGVMSQGELNALSLSLFLPRMMLAESPFRFLIIDDPVQAMDPAKVEGLARVLAGVAETRQVIVFTHDARLVEAVRRLRIGATVRTVMRRAQSVVEIETSLGPVEDHLRDAWSLATSQDEVGVDIARRLVPGFCRSAVEAACVTAIWRRRLSRGDRHDDIEAAIRDTKLMELTALALYDDAARTGEVYKGIENRVGRGTIDVFKACKNGAHHGVASDLEGLVNGARRIAVALEGLR